MHQPRNLALLQDPPRKWEGVASDLGEWAHPSKDRIWKFIVHIDEGSSYGFGRPCFEKLGRSNEVGTGRNVTYKELLQHLHDDWIGHFGHMKVLRVDPEGAWMAKELAAQLEAVNVRVEHIPAEAHWQLSSAERLIEALKETMTKVVFEFPDLDFPELIARASAARIEFDRVRGFSPG